MPAEIGAEQKSLRLLAEISSARISASNRSEFCSARISNTRPREPQQTEDGFFVVKKVPATTNGQGERQRGEIVTSFSTRGKNCASPRVEKTEKIPRTTDLGPPLCLSLPSGVVRTHNSFDRISFFSFLVAVAVSRQPRTGRAPATIVETAPAGLRHHNLRPSEFGANLDV